MKHAKPLPTFLSKRFAGWKATTYTENSAWYARLADEGQRPRAMIISCCDSRVHVTSIFGAETGEFFIHRNIANLVPPYMPDDDLHGTSAAIEYAVRFLKVSNLLVVGHSNCGGVSAYHDLCDNTGKELSGESEFIGRWMEILRPGYEKLDSGETDRSKRLTQLEKNAVLVSLENLMSFPFVADAVEAGTLSLHGLWNEIRNGELEFYDAASGTFRSV
ncbi:MAG: carbonic anhydrase [Paracoccaceae bacterium]